MELRRISLDKLFIDSGVHLTNKSDPNLLRSIRMVGLQNPIIIYRRKKKYYILDGVARYNAIKQLGFTHTICSVKKGKLTRRQVIQIRESIHRSKPS